MFEEVSIERVGENHGWNVYEGFMPFSNQYRRKDEDADGELFIVGYEGTIYRVVLDDSVFE